MTEFWPELLTKASFEKLQQLRREINFVVIGGWAVYLWTRLHKSKDIDIIVDFKALEQLKQRYDLKKNTGLKKYEIKLDKFDIDVYVPYFSEFPVPAEEVLKRTASIAGFRVPEPEVLVVLKQSAEISRRGSVKGEKDAVDILALAAATPFNVQTYRSLLKEHHVETYAGELAAVITGFSPKDAGSLGMGFKEFQSWRKTFLKWLRAAKQLDP